MLFNIHNKIENTISLIEKIGSKQYLFFDIEEAPKYYEMLEHFICYKNYSGRYKYYILHKKKVIRLDYLLEAIMINSDLIQHLKWDIEELEKQIQFEYNFITNLKLFDKNNNPIYPSLKYNTIYLFGFLKEQKQIRIIFTQFTKEKQLFKLIQQYIIWPQLKKEEKKKQLKDKSKYDLFQLNSYCLRNLEFYYRQAAQLNQNLHHFKKRIHKQLSSFLNSVDPQLFDYYLIKFRIHLINDVSALINEINTIINYQTIISNDIYNQALNDVKYTILQRVNNYVAQLITHLNLNKSFQLEFRDKIYEYLQPKINQQMLTLIKDEQQAGLMNQEHDNLKKLILQYMTDFVFQI